MGAKEGTPLFIPVLSGRTRERIIFHMKQANIPDGLVIDDLRGDDSFWEKINALFVPLRSKDGWLGKDRASVQKIEKLRREWGTGSESFPAVICVERGSLGFNTQLAMVEPADFEKSKEELLAEIAAAQKDGNTYCQRSKELVYEAKTGERPPGSTGPRPLKQLPEGLI